MHVLNMIQVLTCYADDNNTLRILYLKGAFE
jgi:hypothetical protein